MTAALAADLDALLADREMAGLFVSEALEHLASIEGLVLQLERAPDDRSLIDAVYRPFHTIKGNALAIGAKHAAAIAHDVEDLLDLIRSDNTSLGSLEINLVLDGTDRLKATMDVLASGLEPPPEGSDGASVNPGPATDGGTSRVSGTTSIKVNTERLDSLVDMVGELMILEAMIREGCPALSIPDQDATRQFASFRRLLSDLQRVSLSMRMVSLERPFQRISRAVHDVSRACGKPVDFRIVGEATELDRRVIEQIGDPLLHLIRNAIDHGVEDPETRAALNKPPRAQLVLTAAHQEGVVCIEISDDGAGLDTEKIRATAVARGLIEATADVSPSQIHQLIFEPGISTAEAITDVSGRGVGMDVVKRNVEGLGGRIDIRTVSGQGTTFSIKVPLTMAIVQGVLIGIGDERYVLPVHALREVVQRIEVEIHGAGGARRFTSVRGLLMPFVELRDLLGSSTSGSDARVVLFVEVDGRRMAVGVDDVFEVQEFVVKPLTSIEHMRGFSGGAVLGNGRVGLILDAVGLFELVDASLCAAA